MNDVLNAAIRCLARREYGAHELTQKLAQKGYSLDDIQEAVTECQRLGLQSDERYIEQISNARIQHGYGPQKIRYDLQKVNISNELISSILDREQNNWLQYAIQVWQKKFKANNSSSNSYHEIQKQKQFLSYKGFPIDIINQVFK